MGSLSTRQIKFTNNIALLIEYCRVNEISLTFGDAYRPQVLQEIYFKEKKTKTLNSKHGMRLAVDFNFFINGKLIYDKDKLQHVGDYWESLDSINKWGGNFSSFIDTPHFQG